MEVPEMFRFKDGQRYDNITIEKQLGEGAYGIVYAVRDAKDCAYAMKVLKLYEISPADRAEYAIRFKRDFETARKVESQYIVKSYRQGEVSGNPYYLMDLCDQGTLAEMIENKKVFTWEDIYNLAYQVLSGLQSMHNKGIFHRDIKPANILKHKDDYKIGDFGTACFVNHRLTKRVLIFGKAQTMFGTLPFMPPEMLRMDFNQTPQFDIYSFGVMLYFLVSKGELPYGYPPNNCTDEQLKQFTARIESGKKRDLKEFADDIPTALYNIINKCIEPKTEKRYSKVEEILAEINKRTPLEKKKPVEPEPEIGYDFDKDILGFQVQTGEEVGRIYNLALAPLSKDNSITIGRSDPMNKNFNSICIKESSNHWISRKQATLIKDTNSKQWILKEGQNRNGEWIAPVNATQLNYKPLGKNGTPIKPNDIISLAGTQLIVLKK